VLPSSTRGGTVGGLEGDVHHAETFERGRGSVGQHGQGVAGAVAHFSAVFGGVVVNVHFNGTGVVVAVCVGDEGVGGQGDAETRAEFYGAAGGGCDLAGLGLDFEHEGFHQFAVAGRHQYAAFGPLPGAGNGDEGPGGVQAAGIDGSDPSGLVRAPDPKPVMVASLIGEPF